MPAPRPLTVGEIIRINGDTDLWKILTIRPRGRGHQITATSLNAYPRIDTTVPATRVTRRDQE
ncbi:hypothetical protein [Leucobacter tenebrionis]|uniref:hypothetical protein n=1 Tax=Leucobacter tenebrionis TaxID=2873270 RepID=UPI001CA6ED76|nr:hypothetical protein [Leucobacter tenebrionis]QZY52903.1 hypothetical protein KVY00_05570 [Leucobacter tenebrionis]